MLMIVMAENHGMAGDGDEDGDEEGDDDIGGIVTKKRVFDGRSKLES